MAGRSLATVAWLLAASVAGCLAEDPVRDPDDVPTDLGAEAGRGPNRLVVSLLDPAGSTVEGAAVQAVPVGGGGASAARSDSAGQVVLRVDDGSVALFAGTTTTAHECRVVDAAAGSVDLTLFPLTRDGSFEAVLADPPAHAGAAEAVWSPTALDLPGDRAAWAERMQAIEVRLAWENSPTGAGDLGIAVGGEAFRYWNNEFQTSYGAFSEQVDLARDDLEGVLDGAAAIRIGPSVSTGHYSVTGIPYELEWHLELAERGPWPQGCSDAFGAADVTGGV